ncbi:MAG: metal-dependent hydrolase [Candidatus Sumerlaeia bacterium]|nr:metal-dependent hydrolase [Candidatus Sumerlaeia bacterium]
MDPLTQMALGAAAGVAVAGRKLPRASLLVGALAGALPDLDVIIHIPGDPLSGIIYHRHFTHSIFLAPVIGLLAAAVFMPMKRYAHLRLWLAAAGIAGALSHAPLDWMTSYGTLILWPFTNARFATDWLPIIDPIFTLTLIGILVAAGCTRRAALRPAGLAFCALFFAAGIWQHSLATGATRELAAARGHEPVRVRALALPGSLLLWRSVYEADGQLHLDSFRTGFLRGTMARPGATVTLVRESDLPAHFASDPEALRAFRVWDWFTDGYTAWVEGGEGRTLGDYRYVLDAERGTPMWGIELDPDAPRHVRRVSFRPSAERSKEELLAGIFRPEEQYQPLEDVVASIRAAAVASPR